jgi:uncharacterized protein
MGGFYGVFRVFKKRTRGANELKSQRNAQKDEGGFWIGVAIVSVQSRVWRIAMAYQSGKEWFFDKSEVERIFEASIEGGSEGFSETDILKTAVDMDIPLDQIHRNIQRYKQGQASATPGRRIRFEGAGGTSGGIGEFFIGLVMAISGGYMFTNMVQVSTRFFHSYHFYGGMSVTPFGVTLIPFCFGIFWLFFSGQSKVGWLLTLGSLLAMFVGIITSIQFRFVHTNLYQLGIVLILLIGGLGLLARSLRPH